MSLPASLPPTKHARPHVTTTRAHTRAHTRHTHVTHRTAPQLFSLENWFRQLCINYAVASPWFNRFIVVNILTNCVVLAMNSSPTRYGNVNGTSVALNATPATIANEAMFGTFEVYFIVVFTLELVVKVVGLGFVRHEHTYLRDPWNSLDLVIVIFGYIGLIPSSTNLTFIRAFRVFRALKTITALPGLRMIVAALIGCLAAMGNIVFLIISSVTVLAIFGLQLFVGTLRCKCVTVMDTFAVVAGSPDVYSSYNWDSYHNNADHVEWVHNASHWVRGDPLSSTNDYRQCNPSRIDDRGGCPQSADILSIYGGERVECLAVGSNPNYGYTNFDHFGWSWIMIFQMVTMDFWEDVYDRVLMANGWGYVFIFVVCIFLGAFYLKNLVLAVVALQFDKTKHENQRKVEDEERERIKIEQEERQKELAAVMDKQMLERERQSRRKQRRGSIMTSKPWFGRGSPGHDDVSSANNPGDGDGDGDDRNPSTEWNAATMDALMAANLELNAGSSDNADEDSEDVEDTLEEGEDDLGHGRGRGHSGLARAAAAAAAAHAAGSTSTGVYAQALGDTFVSTTSSREGAGVDVERESPGGIDALTLKPASWTVAAVAAAGTGNTAAKKRLTLGLNEEAAARKQAQRISKLKRKKERQKQNEKAATASSVQRRMLPVVETFWFSWFITLAIVANTIAMAADTPHDPCLVVKGRRSSCDPDKITADFAVCNYIFTSIFAVEIIMKMLAYGFVGYFVKRPIPKHLGNEGHRSSSNWNRFDFTVVVVSLVEIVVSLVLLQRGGGGSTDLGWVSIFRTFRLLRVLKLGQKWKAMNTLINAIMMSISDVTYLVTVLVIIVYTYAVLGMIVFADWYQKAEPVAGAIFLDQTDGEGPRWNFKDFWHSFLMVFRVLCGEWIEPLAETMRAGRFYGHGFDATFANTDITTTNEMVALFFYLFVLLIGNFTILNLFLATLINTMSSFDKQQEKAKEALAAAAATTGGLVAGVDGRISPTLSEGGGQPIGAGGVAGDRDRDDIISSLSRDGKADDEGDEPDEADGMRPTAAAPAAGGRITKRRKTKRGGNKVAPAATTAAAAAAAAAETAAASPRRESAPSRPVSAVTVDSNSSSEAAADPDVAAAAAAAAAAGRGGRGQARQRSSLPDAASAQITAAAGESTQKVVGEPHTRRESKTYAAFLQEDEAAGKAFPVRNGLNGGLALGHQHNLDNSTAGLKEYGLVGHEGPETLFSPLCCTRGIDSAFAPLRSAAWKIVQAPRFDLFINIMIMWSSVMLCFEDNRIDEPSRADLKEALNVLNHLFVVIFIWEWLVKLFASGWKSYYSSGWNVLDFVIVVVGIAVLALEYTGNAENVKSIRVLRALRALRPLRAVRRFEGMRVVVNSLLAAIPSILNVLVVGMLFWLIFGICGVQLFGGRFGHCIYRDADATLVPQTVVNNQSDCCAGDPSACLGSNADGLYFWVVPAVNFDSTLEGMLALFQVATFEGWMEIMAAASDARGVGSQGTYNHQPIREHSFAASMFFVVFVVFGSFFVLNLFIGVIIQEFNRLKKKNEEIGAGGGLFLTYQQKEYVRTIRQMLKPRPKKRMQAPSNRFRAACFAVARSERFEAVVLLGIVLNTLVFMSKYYQEPAYWGPGPGGLSIANVTFGLNAFFAVAFAIEALIKVVGLGLSRYFSSGWNIFDFVVTLLSLVGVAVDVAGACFCFLCVPREWSRRG